MKIVFLMKFLGIIKIIKIIKVNPLMKMFYQFQEKLEKSLNSPIIKNIILVTISKLKMKNLK